MQISSRVITLQVTIAVIIIMMIITIGIIIIPMIIIQVSNG